MKYSFFTLPLLVSVLLLAGCDNYSPKQFSAPFSMERTAGHGPAIVLLRMKEVKSFILVPQQKDQSQLEEIFNETQRK